MFAGYNIRRSSVVLNPRGRVLGGLGGGYEGEGTGADYGDGFGDLAAFEAAQAFADAEAAATAATAKEAAQFANAKQSAQAQVAAIAAAEDAAYAAQEAAKFANAVASAKASSAAALAAGKAQAAKVSSSVSTVAKAFGPAGAAISLFESVTGFFGNLLAGFYNDNKDFKSAYADLASSLEGAKRDAGYNKYFQDQITLVQKSLESVKNARVEAAVTELYRTYAKRDPDPASLAYWSNAFGSTVTADEVLAFQEALYRNEPNLRPVAVTTQTTTQPSSNLALPIIAAVAGFLIFGG